MNAKDNRPLYSYVVTDPCLVLGCQLDYGHDGNHELGPCQACGGSCTDHASEDEA